MVSELESTADTLRSLGGGLLLTVTGAGISSASGIATFRGSEPDAVWSQHDVQLATRDYLERHPVAQWEWYLNRFAAVDEARPNAGHHALVDLEAFLKSHGADFRLVTQNIDCLHEQAGSLGLIKVHGTSDRLRCSRTGCENAAPHGSIDRKKVDLAPFVSQPTSHNLPRCPSCDSLLRAHVLFFDEYYTEHSDYRFGEVEEAAASCEAVLFVGTSFSVGVTDLVLRQALLRGRPVIVVDPAAPPPLARSRGGAWIEATAEQALPQLVASMRRD